MLQAVCRIKHMHDKKKTLCDDNESVWLGAAPCFLLSRGNKKTKTSVGGATGRRQLRQETKPAALQRKRNRSLHSNTEHSNTNPGTEENKRTHIFTRTHKELECSSLQHQWQAVDSNLFQMLITPLHWHVASLSTTTESMHEYIPVSYIHPRTRFGKEISRRRRYYSPLPPPPSPSSGTWHGQRLAVESYWQQSRWQKKKTILPIWRVPGEMPVRSADASGNMDMLAPTPSRSLLEPRYMNVKGASAPNLSALGEETKAGRPFDLWGHEAGHLGEYGME